MSLRILIVSRGGAATTQGMWSTETDFSILSCIDAHDVFHMLQGVFVLRQEGIVIVSRVGAEVCEDGAALRRGWLDVAVFAKHENTCYIQVCSQICVFAINLNVGLANAEVVLRRCC